MHATRFGSPDTLRQPPGPVVRHLPAAHVRAFPPRAFSLVRERPLALTDGARAAGTQVFAFDEASADAFTEEAIAFRASVLHYTSLMTACALIDIRRDDQDVDAPLTFNHEDPYLFRPKFEADTCAPTHAQPARCVAKAAAHPRAASGCCGRRYYPLPSCDARACGSEDDGRVLHVRLRRLEANDAGSQLMASGLSYASANASGEVARRNSVADGLIVGLGLSAEQRAELGATPASSMLDVTCFAESDAGSALNLEAVPEEGSPLFAPKAKQCGASASKSATRRGPRSSARVNTVPLQALIQSRRNLQKRHNYMYINSCTRERSHAHARTRTHTRAHARTRAPRASLLWWSRRCACRRALTPTDACMIVWPCPLACASRAGRVEGQVRAARVLRREQPEHAPRTARGVDG